MNLVHLKYVTEIAKAKSINKAAENLFMGQPNLSRALKELETSLGITIFERSSKGMMPTPDGEVFLQYAKKILDQVDAVEAIYSGKARAKQKFSVVGPRASYISDAFAQFSSKVSKAMPSELFYKETNAMRTLKTVLQSDFKLGILRYAENYDKYYREALEEKGLCYEMITKLRYTIIMHKDHPLASKDKISFSDLESYTEIAHADPFVPSLPFATVRKEELPDNVDRRIFVYERASQFELLLENHDTFMWVSPIPQKLLDRYDLVQKNCADNKRIYKDILIYRKEYRLTELDRLFIAELHKAKEKHLI